MYILSVKKIVCVVFITKRLKLFLKEILWFAIPSYFAVPYFSFWYFLRHSDIKKQKLGSELACKPPQKWLIIILKDFIKQPVIKQSLTFLSFSFPIDCCISIFSLSLSKGLQTLKTW